VLELTRTTAGLCVVDFQDRLAAAMPEAARASAERNVETLLMAAEILRLPVLATEQYPKGLGRTTSVLASALDRLGVRPVEKLVFSAADVPEVALRTAGVPTWIVVGMETHVCVYQTARELVRRGRGVHVAADACVSRTEDNRRIGLDLCRAAGAVVTSTEVVVFDLLREAGSDAFRTLSRRIR
jgi:nicotinamidase-related amidase